VGEAEREVKVEDQYCRPRGAFLLAAFFFARLSGDNFLGNSRSSSIRTSVEMPATLTGAGNRHVGLIEEAQGGTVFFDEFGELPQRVQVKLLCLLQDRCIRRVGSTRPIEVDVLVVAATNRNLDAMVASEQFRDDLIYRFDEQIMIPPLRLRRDDIPLLADRFLQQECEKLERRIKQAMQRERTLIPAPANMTTNNQRSRLQFAFSEAARDRLARYDYPGNVRELQKIVSKAVGASLSPLVAGMEFRIAFERLTIDEKAVA